MFALIPASIKWLTVTLLTFGIGYMVCVIASKERGLAKAIGYAIGAAIFIFGILMALFRFNTCQLDEGVKRKVISEKLGPERMVDMRGPMAPPKK